MIGTPFHVVRDANDRLRRRFEPIVCEHISDFGKAIGVRPKTPEQEAALVRANTYLYLCESASWMAGRSLKRVLSKMGISAAQAKAALRGEAAAGINVVADVTTFVTQQIHISLDVFPRLVSTKLCSIQPLQRPNGYAFAIKRQDQTGRDLHDLTLHDPNYTAGIAEGVQIPKVKMTISKQLVEVEYRKLMHENSHEMDVALESQYGIDIESMGDVMTSDEMAWEVDRTVVSRIQAFAGADYYFDPTNGGVYDTMSEIDKQAYDRNFLRITVAGAEIDMQARIFRRPNWYLAGTNVIKHLAKLPEYKSMRQGDAMADRVIGNGQIIQSGDMNDGVVYHDPQLDPNLMLMGYTENMNPFYAGYIFLPFSLASILTAAFTDPDVLLTKKARALAFATYGVKPEQYARIWLRARS